MLRGERRHDILQGARSLGDQSSSSCRLMSGDDVRPIPLLTTYDYVTFRRQHLLPNKPCLFAREATADWPAFRLWFDKPAGNASSVAVDWQYLEATYGDEHIQVVECKSNFGGRAHPDQAAAPLPSTFRDLFKLWQTGTGRKLYLKDWHLPRRIARRAAGGERAVRRELYSVHECWLDDWMDEYYAAQTDDDFRFVVSASGPSRNRRLELTRCPCSTLAAATPSRLCIVMSASRVHLEHVTCAKAARRRHFLLDLDQSLRLKAVAHISTELHSTSFATHQTSRERGQQR